MVPKNCFGRIIGMVIVPFKIDIRSCLDLLETKMLESLTVWNGYMARHTEDLFLFKMFKIGSWKCMTQFLDDLYAAQVGSSSGDKLVWLPSTNKGFQIKSYYTVINTIAAYTLNFPWKCVWRGISPPSTHICLGGKTGKISSGK